jgi:hypothetical protein
MQKTDARWTTFRRRCLTSHSRAAFTLPGQWKPELCSPGL